VSVLAILLTGAGLLAVLLGRVLVGLLTSEAVATVPHVSRTLVRRAAEQLPSEHQARFAEEWEAHVEDFGERRLAALKWAVGISLGVRELAAELAPAPQPERAEAQAESTRDDSVVEARARTASDTLGTTDTATRGAATRARTGSLKWRKLRGVPIWAPVILIHTPEGDLIVPRKRRRSAAPRRVVQALRLLARPTRQAGGVATTYFRQIGKDLRLFLTGFVTALRQGLVLSRDVLAGARAFIQAVGELWRSQGRVVRLLAVQLVRADRMPLVTSLAVVAGGLTVALLLLALLGAR
jgi:hypothetical protein